MAIQQAPGLAPEPVHVYQFLGVPVTLDQIIVYICVVLTVVVGAVVLRYTDVGLKVRAMVDSPAMTDLSGTNPTTVSVGVWAVSTFFAGLCGVLAAPIIGLDPNNFTLLIAASFAAVVAAKLRSLPIAVAVGLLMGVATSLFQRYLPPAEQLDHGDHRRCALHGHRTGARLQPRPPGTSGGHRGMGRCAGPGHRRRGREWKEKIRAQTSSRSDTTAA